MRKVKFKKWIPIEYNTLSSKTSCHRVRVDGTGKWEDDFTHEGVFHQWANAYEEFESGAGNYTVALIELKNGEMVEVLPSNITFINI
jgi:hypothetical protein